MDKASFSRLRRKSLEEQFVWELEHSFELSPKEAEAILLALATNEIYVSTGSACSEDSEEVSHVLNAIGVKPEIARSTLRLSLGRFNTENDVEIVLAELPGIVEKLREISSFDIDF